MSGTVVSNVFRTSGVIAATAAGINFQSSVVTGTTLSVTAGNGYFIDTTSNICTVTLPGSAEAGDQIVLVDYARTWGTYSMFIDSNGLNFQGENDTFIVEYGTSGATVNIVYSGASKGWTPISDDVVTDAASPPNPQRAIFGFGNPASGYTNLTNLVNTSGVVGNDVTGVGTARGYLYATNYGGDKALFGFGNTGSFTAITNLVSNQGVVATDTSGVGTARTPTATTYGGKSAGTAIWAFGFNGSSNLNTINLVSSSGVVAADSSGNGTARRDMASSGFGNDKGIYGYGYTSGDISTTNIVSNTGTMGNDVGGVGTARAGQASTTYGGDKAIFGYGYVDKSMTNLVSNTGVVASDTTGVGTGRHNLRAAGYGGDKALFGYGFDNSTKFSITNLVSNQGVVASDTSGVGTERQVLGASSYGYS